MECASIPLAKAENKTLHEMKEAECKISSSLPTANLGVVVVFAQPWETGGWSGAVPGGAPAMERTFGLCAMQTKIKRNKNKQRKLRKTI